jgi:hypothetical protein
MTVFQLDLRRCVDYRLSQHIGGVAEARTVGPAKLQEGIG